jgi:hypothetical protein
MKMYKFQSGKVKFWSLRREVALYTVGMEH